jgi:hypothetical protein
MLLSNPATHDLRPLNEARSLARAGYHVTILAWDREGETRLDSVLEELKQEEERDGRRYE